MQPAVVVGGTSAAANAAGWKDHMPHTSDPPEDRAEPPAPEGYRLEFRVPTPGTLVAQLAGELDYVGAPSLRRVLAEHLDRCAILVVDLTAVRLLSAAGIEMLVDVDELGRSYGAEVRVVADSRAVLRPIRLTGVDAQLRLYPSVAQALQ